jgi:hypothetical protein
MFDNVLQIESRLLIDYTWVWGLTVRIHLGLKIPVLNGRYFSSDGVLCVCVGGGDEHLPLLCKKNYHIHFADTIIVLLFQCHCVRTETAEAT